MIRAPSFWTANGVLPRLLAPASRAWAAATARRVARPGWQAPVPVLCCGGATVGGAGKTTVALDLASRLIRRGVATHCLLRGYGGRVRGPLRVDPNRHGAGLVGDEALLLAAVAPTWVAADRTAAARAAVAVGAAALVMDDGLQNPGLVKTASLLVIDGAGGFGNNRVMPGGPLREPVAAAAARCRAAVLIGEDRTGALAALPPELPVLRAAPEPDTALHGTRVLAFAGIARPANFFTSLQGAGADLAGAVAFPDHHPFRSAELRKLVNRAASLGAVLVTTPKDAVRLPEAIRAHVQVVGLRLRWTEPDRLDALLRGVVP